MLWDPEGQHANECQGKAKPREPACPHYCLDSYSWPGKPQLSSLLKPREGPATPHLKLGAWGQTPSPVQLQAKGHPSPRFPLLPISLCFCPDSAPRVLRSGRPGGGRWATDWIAAARRPRILPPAHTPASFPTKAHLDFMGLVAWGWATIGEGTAEKVWMQREASKKSCYQDPAPGKPRATTCLVPPSPWLITGDGNYNHH